MSRRLRVLLVPEWYPWPEAPMRGTWVREQAGIIAAEVDLVVLALDEAEQAGTRFRPWSIGSATEDGVRVLRLRYRRSRVPKLAFVWRQWGMIAALLRLRSTGWAPDVVHARVFSAAFPAIALARLARAPLIVSEHFTGFPRGTLTRWDRLIARLAFDRAALVCPDSAELGRHVAATGTRTEIRHVPNVFDDDAFALRPGRMPDGRTRLVNVASLDDKKGHADLLEALAIVRRTRPGVELDVLGDGPLRRALEAQARRAGLADAVTFHGGQPKARVAAALAQADAFVLPSLWENEPHALIEAQATGVPSVATAVGGVPAMLPPESGVLVPPGEPEAFAAGILDVIARADAFDRRAIAERALARWGRAAFTRRWLGIYAEVLGQPPAAGGQRARDEVAVVDEVVPARQQAG